MKGITLLGIFSALIVIGFANNTDEISLNDESSPRSTFLIAPLYHSSHWKPLLEISKELKSRGHKIILLLAEEFQGTENPTESQISFADEVRFVSVGYDQKFMQDMCRKMTEIKPYEIWKHIAIVGSMMDRITDQWVSNFKTVLSLAESGEINSVISDLDPGIMVACKKTNLPCIHSSPFVLRNPDFEMSMGSSFPPWFPLNVVGSGVPETFFERLITQIGHALLKGVGKFFQVFLSGLSEKLAEHDVSFKFDRLTPVLVNSFQGFDWNAPIPPHVKFVGPIDLENIEQKKSNTLQRYHEYLERKANPSLQNHDSLIPEDHDLFSWLNEQDSVILISFGKSVELSQSQVDVVIGFIRKWKGSVIWTIKKHQMFLFPEDMPKNLRIENWVNYVGVASHPNVKVVISQCGTASAHEAVLVETPLLCVPILFDQFDLAVLVRHNRVGEMLDKTTWTPDILVETVTQMVENQDYYRRNAQKLVRIAKSSKPSMKWVGDWVEMIVELGPEAVVPPVNMNPLWFFEHHELWYLMMVFFGIGGILLFPCLRCCRNQSSKLCRKFKRKSKSKSKKE